MMGKLSKHLLKKTAALLMSSLLMVGPSFNPLMASTLRERAQQLLTHRSGGIGWGNPCCQPEQPGLSDALLDWSVSSGKIDYIIWTDLPGACKQSKGSSGSQSLSHGLMQASRYDVVLTMQDHQRFAFSYDLQPGNEKIELPDNSILDLATGRLILIKVQDQKLEFKQTTLDEDLIRLIQNQTEDTELLRNSFKSYAAQNQQIQDFF